MQIHIHLSLSFVDSNKMYVITGRFGLISLTILHSQYLYVELCGNSGRTMWPVYIYIPGVVSNVYNDRLCEKLRQWLKLIIK